MIRLNLLPFRAARKKENVRRQVSVIILSLVFAIIVMGYLFVTLSSKITDLNTKIKETKTEVEKYKYKEKIKYFKKEATGYRQT